MQRSDRWPEDYDPDSNKSRPTSRRNSASLSRRNSVTKKEKEGKKKTSPLNSTPSSVNSTPKKVGKPQNLDFVVTGRQCLKKSDRANSLPGYHRRPSAESVKTKKLYDSPKRVANVSQSSKSRETSLEDDMSLDLSQVSDFEDTHSKYGVKQKFSAIATSTPKSGVKVKPRSGSLQNQMQNHKLETTKRLLSFESKSKSSKESKDSLFKTSSSNSNYRHNASTELDYSSVSPEYSGQSSTDLSPRTRRSELLQSSHTAEAVLSSCCSWQDCSEMERTAMCDREGEWSSFWANYNNSLSKVPVKNYYDQCPTPYRTENIDLADLGNVSELSTDGSRKRSPDNIQNINYVIRNEGLHLTPRETQNMIKCAHILGNVLSKAIERRCREKERFEEKIHNVTIDKEDAELEIKKKTLTLELTETSLPEDEREEKRCETVTTQTDISLPNTKSAPKIFEKILRQLSKTSLDEGLNKMIENKALENKALENKDETTDKNDAKKEN